MTRDQAYTLIRQTFTQGFDKTQFRNLAINILNRIDESKASVWNSQYIKDAFKDHVQRYERLGTYTSPENEKLDVLIVHLTTESKLERARTAIRNFVAHHLKTRDEKDAALVAFVSPTEKQWRFSYVKMEYATVKKESGKIDVETRLTPARRFSYIVGEGESCHTAQTRFLGLLQDTKTDPKLAEIEDAFSVEAVTKEFFKRYVELFDGINQALEKLFKKDKTIYDEFQAKNVNTVDFAKKLMGQIVFLYFLQKKGWLGVAKGEDWGSGPHDFLRRLAKGEYGKYNNLFNDILEPLFYDTLASDRGHEAWCKHFQCRIPFLNGGLFEPPGGYDWRKTDILLPNRLFTNNDHFEEGIIGTGVLDVFDRHNFTVNEAEPLEKEVAIDPEMLGKVFENLIEENRRKGLGAFYTPREIVHYMCQESLINYLNSALNKEKELVPRKDIERFVHVGDQAAHYEAARISGTKSYKPELPNSIEVHSRLIDDKLSEITVCDPAVGSGAFPVGMMMEIVRSRSVLTAYFNDVHERTPYIFKRHAIQNSLYGVDIDPGAVEIARVRLWLSLVVDEEDVQQIKPLPNLDYKIMAGDSLLGIEKDLFNNDLFIQLEKQKSQYFDETDAKEKASLKKQIDNLICQLTDEKEIFDFDIFFSEIFQHQSGFDVIIGNPPYGAQFSKAFRQWAREVYETATGELDSYTLFVERGVKLLSARGCLTYILPDTWLTLINAERFRRWILSNHEVNELTMLNGLVFESVVVDTMLIFLIRRKPSSQSRTRIIIAKKTQKISNVAELPIVSSVNQLTWLDTTRSQIKPFALPELSALLEKLRLDSTPLANLIDYRAGCKPYEKGKGNPPQTESTLVQKPFTASRMCGEGWMPLLRGNDIQRYRVNPKKPEWILYGEWLAAPRTMNVFSGPRILIQAIRNPSLRERIIATFTDKAFITRINVYSFLKKNTTKIDLLTILGILNSRLMNWLLKTDYGLHTYVITGVLAFPIKHHIAEDRNGKLISELVEKVLLVKQRNGETVAIEKEIDGLVYALYGLTDDEKAIIEESMSKK